MLDQSSNPTTAMFDLFSCKLIITVLNKFIKRDILTYCFCIMMIGIYNTAASSTEYMHLEPKSTHKLEAIAVLQYYTINSKLLY